MQPVLPDGSYHWCVLLLTHIFQYPLWRQNSKAAKRHMVAGIRDSSLAYTFTFSCIYVYVHEYKHAYHAFMRVEDRIFNLCICRHSDAWNSVLSYCLKKKIFLEHYQVIYSHSWSQCSLCCLVALTAPPLCSAIMLLFLPACNSILCFTLNWFFVFVVLHLSSIYNFMGQPKYLPERFIFMETCLLFLTAWLIL